MSKVVAHRGRLLAAALGTIVAFAPAVAVARGAHTHSGHGHCCHASTKSKDANTNANGKKNATDRETGHARAEDRMNQNGLDHNHAGITDSDSTPTSGG